MSSHRRYRRKRSSESSSSSSRWSNSRSSMRASTTEKYDDVHGGHRRLKRSSASLPVWGSPASQHSWVLLNRTGARLDSFSGDHTTSATSRTSKGQEISVSFELAEPPETSVLTIDNSPRAKNFSGHVIAAHHDVVLLAITSREKRTGPWNTSPPDRVIDLFVYQASLNAAGRWRPSLLLLPSAGGPTIYCFLLDGGDGEIGIMSCKSNYDDESPSFVVAELQMCWKKGSDVRLFRPGSGKWESFDNSHVHGANGGRDLQWWSTDAVVPYRRRDMMIWVDYYHGMVLMDLSSQSEAMNPPRPPRLRYVPLPVDRVDDPEDNEFGRGFPKASRRVCVTRYGVKFVSVDSQHWSNFGVGHQNVLKWNHRFRITTWSLREDEDDDYTWRKDITMPEEEFWDAIDGGDRRFSFPRVQPRFPVVIPDNPDVVIFRLEKAFYDRNETKWMIEVDLRKKVLLAATPYSKNKSNGLFGDAETINSVRMESDLDPIPSELPRYLDGGQACKKRRQ